MRRRRTTIAVASRSLYPPRPSPPLTPPPSGDYYILLVATFDTFQRIGLPRKGIMGASCRRDALNGRRAVPYARNPSLPPPIPLFGAPRWLQTTDLNQLKFNPEPGRKARKGARACAHYSPLLVLPFFPFIVSSSPSFLPSSSSSVASTFEFVGLCSSAFFVRNARARDFKSRSAHGQSSWKHNLERRGFFSETRKSVEPQRYRKSPGKDI